MLCVLWVLFTNGLPSELTGEASQVSISFITRGASLYNKYSRNK